jgi:hypothetical protein
MHVVPNRVVWTHGHQAHGVAERDNSAMTHLPRCQAGTAAASEKTSEHNAASAGDRKPRCHPHRYELETLTSRPTIVVVCMPSLLRIMGCPNSADFDGTLVPGRSRPQHQFPTNGLQSQIRRSWCTGRSSANSARCMPIVGGVGEIESFSKLPRNRRARLILTH